MIRKITVSALFSVCVVVAGCVPVPLASTVYEPHGRGKIVVSDPGGKERHVSLVNELEPGSRLYIGAEMPTKDYPRGRLWVTLTLDPLQQARFDVAAVLIRSDPASDAQTIAIGQLNVDNAVPPRSTEQSPSDVMKGGSGTPGKVESQTAFRFSIDLPFDKPQNFTATPPAIWVGEHLVQIAPIHFTVERQRHVAIYGVKS